MAEENWGPGEDLNGGKLHKSDKGNLFWISGSIVTVLAVVALITSSVSV